MLLTVPAGHLPTRVLTWRFSSTASQGIGPLLPVSPESWGIGRPGAARAKVPADAPSDLRRRQGSERVGTPTGPAVAPGPPVFFEQASPSVVVRSPRQRGRASVPPSLGGPFPERPQKGAKPRTDTVARDGSAPRAPHCSRFLLPTPNRRAEACSDMHFRCGKTCSGHGCPSRTDPGPSFHPAGQPVLPCIPPPSTFPRILLPPPASPQRRTNLGSGFHEQGVQGWGAEVTASLF